MWARSCCPLSWRHCGCDQRESTDGVCAVAVAPQDHSARVPAAAGDSVVRRLAPSNYLVLCLLAYRHPPHHTLGNVNRIAVPSSSTLSARTLPPCASTSCLTIVR